MELLSAFKDFTIREKLFNTSHRLLVAVSGGIDSMVLSDLCKKAGYDFAIAHCNFQLRGEESDIDEKFVKEYADTSDIPFYVRKFYTQQYSDEHKLSIQEAARELRYKWFYELLNESADKKFKLNYILTAHHADDNAETILMNFFRHSGIKGLKGILPKSEKLIRPLLFAERKDIVLYAEQNKITFREDSSNISEKYTRNYYRHTVIPAINQLIPGASQAIIRNAEKFRDINNIYDSYISQILKKLIEVRDHAEHISVLKLSNTSALNTILFEIASLYNFKPSQVNEISKLLVAASGKYITSSTHRILRNRKWLIITPLKNPEMDFVLIEEGQQHITFPGGELSIKEYVFDGKISKDANIAQLDRSEISYPLILRKWKQGDYFYPLGMKKKKKLSRFFIDLKLSVADKENIWVIESNKKILWIAGLRIDDRFRIQENTKSILQLTVVTQ